MSESLQAAAPSGDTQRLFGDGNLENHKTQSTNDRAPRTTVPIEEQSRWDYIGKDADEGQPRSSPRPFTQDKVTRQATVEDCEDEAEFSNYISSSTTATELQSHTLSSPVVEGVVAETELPREENVPEAIADQPPKRRIRKRQDNDPNSPSARTGQPAVPDAPSPMATQNLSHGQPQGNSPPQRQRRHASNSAPVPAPITNNMSGPRNGTDAWPTSPITSHSHNGPTPVEFSTSPGSAGSVISQPGFQPFPSRGPIFPHADMQYFAPSTVQSRFSGSSVNLPFPIERTPLSGYQLLAAKITGGLGGPPTAPIYRRFESLNHRLLLCFQDEIIELEDQLRTLDAADTQARQHPAGIYPASRRFENMNPSDLHLQKTEILGAIGYKLIAYNQIIASFTDILKLHVPNVQEVQDYRSFLAQTQPIVAEEAKFLDASDDLISLLGHASKKEDVSVEDVKTLVPGVVAANNRGSNSPEQSQQSKKTFAKPVAIVGLGILIAVSFPVVIFALIPDFAIRMAVVALAGAGVCAGLAPTGVLRVIADEIGLVQCVLWAGIYGGVMAVIAASFVLEETQGITRYGPS